jgi:protoheme IX farnesyltransferase
MVVPPLPGLNAVSSYWSLVRPPILAMVLLAMAAAAWIAGGKMPPPGALHALLGAGLVIAGALALNQRLDFRTDAKMARTAGRPLPSGRLSDRQVTRFGLVASAVGLGYLAALAAPAVAVLAAVSWVLYVWIYTPLKSVTLWQTPVGALAGAMPVLLGAAAVAALANPVAWTLFAIVFCWQFPHAMAIAWLYREQYALAEVKLATVVDPSGRAAGRLAVLGAATLLPLSLLPAGRGSGDWRYIACAAALGLVFLGCSIGLLRHPGETTARRLFWASLGYLPMLLAAMLLWPPR